VFYERLKNICDNRGITVTYLLKTLNISTSKGTAWKNGSTPNSEVALKIADYFNVSTDYLLGNETKDMDTEIKFALFDGADNITDEMFEEVKNFAKFVQKREQDKNGHK